MKEASLDKLVANGTIKSYRYSEERTIGDSHESLDILFPNGEWLHIHSLGLTHDEDQYSALSIS